MSEWETLQYTYIFSIKISGGDFEMHLLKKKKQMMKDWEERELKKNLEKEFEKELEKALAQALDELLKDFQ